MSTERQRHRARGAIAYFFAGIALAIISSILAFAVGANVARAIACGGYCGLIVAMSLMIFVPCSLLAVLALFLPSAYAVRKNNSRKPFGIVRWTVLSVAIVSVLFIPFFVDVFIEDHLDLAHLDVLLRWALVVYVTPAVLTAVCALLLLRMFNHELGAER